MAKNYFISGEWNLICDSCGKKIKAHEAKHRWDGLVVCPEDWEPRQPQDFVRAKTDKISVPFTRPRPEDVFFLTLGVAESFDLTDQSSFAVSKVLSDTVTLQDNSLVAKAVIVSDTFSLTDAQSKNIQLQKTDSVLLDDRNYFAENYLVNNDDYVQVGIKFLRGMSLADSTTFSENVIPNRITPLTLTDSFAFTDSGTIQLPQYIDVTYFASDYMAPSQSI